MTMHSMLVLVVTEYFANLRWYMTLDFVVTYKYVSYWWW